MNAMDSLAAPRFDAAEFFIEDGAHMTSAGAGVVR